MVNIRRHGSYAVLAMVLAVLLSIGFSSESPSEAAVTTFEVGMSGANEVPAVTSPASGFARFTFDDVTRELTFAITASGVSSNQMTASHIHRGAVGVNGPIIYTLAEGAFTQIAGRITLTEGDIADLRAGNLYVNIHTIQHPGGAARGQMFISVADALRARFEAGIDAFNRASPSFFDFFTDAGLRSSFDLTRAEAIAAGRDFFEEGGPPGGISFRSFTVVTSSGTQAVTDVELVFGNQVDLLRFEWILDAGNWKINAETDLPETIPAGARVVNVRAQEFAFVIDDRAGLSTGNFALRLDNVGRQEHEAFIVKLERPEPLREIILAGGPDDEGPPAGVIPVGGAFAEPGEQGTAVFTRPLASGRYGMVCFVPDEASGAPHAVLGMFTEFTVGAGAGGISPPSTGDGGLLGFGENGSAMRYGLIVLASLVLASPALLIGKRAR